MILSAGAELENLGIGEIAAMPDNLPHAWLCVQLDDKRRALDSKLDELIEPRDYINWQPKNYWSAIAACYSDSRSYLRSTVELLLKPLPARQGINLWCGLLEEARRGPSPIYHSKRN
jgi:hypothetical protein